MRGSGFLRAAPGGDIRSVLARAARPRGGRGGPGAPDRLGASDHQRTGHTGTTYVATDTLRFGVPGPNADPSASSPRSAIIVRSAPGTERKFVRIVLGPAALE